MKNAVNNTSGASALQIMLGIIIVILLIIVGLILEPRIRLAKAVKNIQKAENVEMYIKNIETNLKLYKLVKKCPQCAEEVNIDAIVCKHCQSQV